MKTVTTLIASSLMVASSRAQLVLVAHGDGTGLPVDRPEVYDGLFIGTALTPPVGIRVQGDPNFVVQRFRVESSRTFSRGNTVDVYFRTLPENVAPKVPEVGLSFKPLNGVGEGEGVLLVASVAKDGTLPVPDFGEFDPRNIRRVALGENAPPSAFCVSYFPTVQFQLSNDGDPKWRLLEGLAGSLFGSSDENARNVAQVVSLLPGRDEFKAFGGPEDRLSKTFAMAVDKDTAYHRSLIDYALNSLGYWGYADKFRRDLREAVSDPNAFPNGVPKLQFEEDTITGGNPVLPKGFKHDTPLPDSGVVALLRSAKSSSISIEYLKSLRSKPEVGDLRALARFLDSPDPRLRHTFVKRLAEWYGESGPEEPEEVEDPSGGHRWEYPGLDVMVARWKARLKTP